MSRSSRPAARATSAPRFARPQTRRALVACAALLLLFALAACDGGGGGAKSAGGWVAGSARLMRAMPDPAGGPSVELIESGDALFGVRVYLGGTDRVARTDSAGRYRFEDVPAGDYEVLFERDGYESATRAAKGVAAGKTVDAGVAELVEKPRAADADVNLAAFSGVAMVEGGEPGTPGGGGVEVTAVGSGGMVIALTENDGSYFLERLKPGRYRLYYRAIAPGYEVATLTRDALVGLNRIHPPVTLAPAGGAAGSRGSVGPIRDQVASEDGKQNVFGSLAVAGTDEARRAAFAASTLWLDTETPRVAGLGPDGSFTFSDLDPGRYAMRIEGGAIELVEAVAFEVAAGANTLLVVAGALTSNYDEAPAADAAPPLPEDAPSVALKGRLVLADPDATPSALVGLGGTAYTTKPGRDGSFRFDAIPPGAYDFFASARGHADFAQALDLPEAGREYDLGDILLERDIDRPKVVASSPADGTRGVLVDEVVSLVFEFDQDMDPGATKAAFSIEPAASYALYMGRESDLSSDRVLHVELYGYGAADALRHDARYRARIAASAASAEGATMERPFDLEFRTAKPSIIDTYPAKGSGDGRLSANQHLLVYCNAPIDPEQITERVVSIRPDNGGSAAIVRVATDSVTGWGILEVSYPFEEDTNYTVRIDGRLKSTNGKGFANTPYEFSFRTAKLNTQTLDDVLTSGRRVRRSDQGKFNPRYRY